MEARIRLGEDERLSALRRDALAGLRSRPKELPPKWFYDERGSDLFEEITRLPEYYLTRRERSILAERAQTIAELSRAEILIELGAGSSEKTRLLLDALTGSGSLARFVPLDVSETALEASAAAIAADYPGLEVEPVVADFDGHLGFLPNGRRRLVAFLGSSIGNLLPEQRAAFLGELRTLLAAGDALLVGFDLVKDTHRLEAAYDDAAGVTAEFNRNVLAVLNRELGADFELEAFEHVARFDAEREWIEMRLRSLAEQRVTIPDLGLEVEFTEGEEMRTEISAKFRRDGVERELLEAGFEPSRWWTDADDDFAVSLSFPAASG